MSRMPTDLAASAVSVLASRNQVSIGITSCIVALELAKWPALRCLSALLHVPTSSEESGRESFPSSGSVQARRRHFTPDDSGHYLLQACRGPAALHTRFGCSGSVGRPGARQRLPRDAIVFVALLRQLHYCSGGDVAVYTSMLQAMACLPGVPTLAPRARTIPGITAMAARGG